MITPTMFVQKNNRRFSLLPLNALFNNTLKDGLYFRVKCRIEAMFLNFCTPILKPCEHMHIYAYKYILLIKSIEMIFVMVLLNEMFLFFESNERDLFSVEHSKAKNLIKWCSMTGMTDAVKLGNDWTVSVIRWSTYDPKSFLLFSLALFLSYFLSVTLLLTGHNVIWVENANSKRLCILRGNVWILTNVDQSMKSSSLMKSSECEYKDGCRVVLKSLERNEKMIILSKSCFFQFSSVYSMLD